MVVVLKAILSKIREWVVSLTTIVMNIARAIKWNEVRTALQKYVTNAAVWANTQTLRITGIDMSKHMAENYL